MSAVKGRKGKDPGRKPVRMQIHQVWGKLSLSNLSFTLLHEYSWRGSTYWFTHFQKDDFKYFVDAKRKVQESQNFSERLYYIL